MLLFIKQLYISNYYIIIGIISEGIMCIEYKIDGPKYFNQT